jgi:hypothetical protein
MPRSHLTRRHSELVIPAFWVRPLSMGEIIRDTAVKEFARQIRERHVQSHSR